MALVYEAKNLVNGKRYIGFTSNTLAYRERQHRSYGRQGRGHIFHKALRKYGDESFVFRIMADFDGDVDIAKLYEFEAIEKYKPEYNIRAGGEGGGPIAESTRLKMSAAQKGRVSSLRGVPLSAEHKKSISKTKTGQKRKLVLVVRHTVPVRCVTDGRVFNSCRDADRFYGFSLGSVSAAISGYRSHAQGKIFEPFEASK